MPSFRVPNFIDFNGLTNEDRYHLFEGYCINAPEKIKSSGKYYQRVWMDSKGELFQLLDYMGYSRWWEIYEIDTSFFGRLFGKWKKRQKGPDKKLQPTSQKDINNAARNLEKSVATITKDVNRTIKLNEKISHLGASALVCRK